MEDIYRPKNMVNRKLITLPLQSTTGFLIAEKHLTVREAGLKGKFLSFVPGHGGDVIFAKHRGGGRCLFYDRSKVFETDKKR